MDNIEIEFKNGSSISIDPRLLDADLGSKSLDVFLEEKKSKRLENNKINLDSLIYKLEKGRTVEVPVMTMETYFPAIKEHHYLLNRDDIIVSSEDVLKKWCKSNMYFYEYNFDRNSFLIKK